MYIVKYVNICELAANKTNAMKYHWFAFVFLIPTNSKFMRDTLRKYTSKFRFCDFEQVYT